MYSPGHHDSCADGRGGLETFMTSSCLRTRPQPPLPVSRAYATYVGTPSTILKRSLMLVLSHPVPFMRPKYTGKTEAYMSPNDAPAARELPKCSPTCRSAAQWWSGPKGQARQRCRWRRCPALPRNPGAHSNKARPCGARTRQDRPWASLKRKTDSKCTCVSHTKMISSSMYRVRGWGWRLGM